MAGNLLAPLTTEVAQYGGFVREASVADAIDIAARLREADREEIQALLGLPPSLVLPAAVGEGRAVCVAGLLEDNKPEIIFGLDPVDGHPDTAVGWMVSTPRIFEHAGKFAPASKAIHASCHEAFPLIVNFIDARNTRHIEWCKWLGFKVLRRIENFGAASLPFYEIASFRP